MESALQKIKYLETRIKEANQKLVDYREFVAKRLDMEKLTETIATASTVDPIVAKRDDDSHYFTSYGSNGSTVFPIFCSKWLISRK